MANLTVSRMEDADMNGTNDHARANAPYSYRVPSPHRVHVPPPAFTEEGEPNLHVGKIVPQPGLDLEFLNELQYDHLYDQSFTVTGGWTYGRRHSATEILPFLYLGPMTAARDREALKRDGITMLLAIAHRSALPSRMVIGPLKAADELGLDKAVIEVADNSELIAAFPRAIQIINEHLVKTHHMSPQNSLQPASGDSLLHDSGDTAPSTKTGKVMVFCESGNERSAAVVVAYLLHMFEGTNHIKACQMCNMRRFSINLDDGMKQCLLSYYMIVQAQRDVRAGTTETQSSASTINKQDVSNSHQRGSSKRMLDMDMDEDEDMTAADDRERFFGRDFTPFQDQESSEQ